LGTRIGPGRPMGGNAQISRDPCECTTFWQHSRFSLFAAEEPLQMHGVFAPLRCKGRGDPSVAKAYLKTACICRGHGTRKCGSSGSPVNPCKCTMVFMVLGLGRPQGSQCPLKTSCIYRGFGSLLNLGTPLPKNNENHRAFAGVFGEGVAPGDATPRT